MGSCEVGFKPVGLPRRGMGTHFGNATLHDAKCAMWHAATYACSICRVQVSGRFLRVLS